MKNNKHILNEMPHITRIVEFLDNPERIKSFPPNDLLKMLSIKKTDNILDLGAGTGYLTVPAAQMVDGLVYALDINPQMLDVINCKAKSENIPNIILIKGSTDDIPLPDSSIDIVLASLILHEVRPLSKTMQQIKHVLKDGGQFMCLEYEISENHTEGPPMHIRVPSKEMEREIENAGLIIAQKVFLKNNIYAITAKK